MAIHEIPIDRLEDLFTHFHTLDPDGNKWLYRGHKDASWRLEPTLFRLQKPRKWTWVELQTYLLDAFKKQSQPYLNRIPDGEIEWLALAQHHGLPTILLDWTENPLVALLFSVDDLTWKGDSALWACAFKNTTRKIEALREVPEGTVYYPYHSTARISSQRGCFTVHTSAINQNIATTIDQGELIQSHDMYKFIIPSSRREPIKWTLDRLGIDSLTLFPSLDGLAQKLMWDAYKTTHNENVVLPIIRKEDLYS